MRFVRASLGYGLAGLFAMSIWDAISATAGLGLFGGWLAGAIIIGTMWTLNHYLGLIPQPKNAAFVDMAFGIFLTGIARDVFIQGDLGALVSSVPTIVVVLVGGALAGWVAHHVHHHMESSV